MNLLIKIKKFLSNVMIIVVLSFPLYSFISLIQSFFILFRSYSFEDPLFNITITFIFNRPLLIGYSMNSIVLSISLETIASSFILSLLLIDLSSFTFSILLMDKF